MSIEPMTTPMVTGSDGAAGHAAALSATGLKMLPKAGAGEGISGTGAGAGGAGAAESDSRAARCVSA